jgi:hypothetical protein
MILDLPPPVDPGGGRSRLCRRAAAVSVAISLSTR